jgi:hypothetical protein
LIRVIVGVAVDEGEFTITDEEMRSSSLSMPPDFTISKEQIP